MTFLDKPVGELSLSELLRIVSREVSRQVPAIPAGVSTLGDQDAPLVPPDKANDGQALVFDSSTGGYIVSDEVISAISAATADLADEATLAHDIDDNIVTTAKIVDDAVNAAKLGNNSVDTAAIVDLAVQTAKLNDLGVTTGKIDALAVTTAKIDALAVTAAKIDSLAVTTAKIDAAAVTTAKIGDLQVTTGKIALLAVDTAQINDLSVSTGKIALLAVGTAQIASAAITNAKINDLDAVKITAGDIASARMTTNFLTAAIATITTLSSVTVNAGTITAGTFTGTTLQTAASGSARLVMDSSSLRSLDSSNATLWSIDAATGVFSKGTGILVSTLDAITSSLGLITAGTVTGATVQTAAAGTQRVVMDTTGLRVETSATPAVVLVNLPTDSTQANSFKGSIESGDLKVTGNMTVQGTTNKLDAGATLSLSSKQQGPSSPPTLTFSYDTHTITNGSGQDTLLITYRSGGHYNTAGGAAHGTTVYASTYLNGSDGLYYLEEITASTYRRNRTKQLSETALIPYDVVYVAAETAYYVLFNNAGVPRVYRYPYDLSTTGTLCTFAGTSPTTGLVTTNGGGLYWDGTNIVIVTAKSGDGTAISRRQFTVSGTTLTATGSAVNSSATAAITSGTMHGAHLASTEFWIAVDNVGYRFNQATTTTTPVEQEVNNSVNGWQYSAATIDPDNSSGLRGFIYDGSSLWALSQIRIITKLTSFTWSTTTSKLYVGYSWTDSTHQTDVQTSSYANITLTNKQRGTLTITIPQAPAAITGFNVYALFNATAPAIASLWLQTTSTNTSSTSAAVAATMTSYVASGTAGRTTNDFANSTAVIKPNNPLDSAGNDYAWRIEGNGRINIFGATIQNQGWIYDDFYYPAGLYPTTTAGNFGMYWSTALSGTVASVTAGTSTASHAGILQLVSGTSTTGKATCRSGVHFGYGTYRLRCSALIMVDTVSDGTNSYWWMVGLSTTSGSGTGATHLVAADTGIVIQPNAASTNVIQLAVSDGGTLVTQNSSVTLVGGVWHFVEWEVDAALTGVNWWVDGTKQTAIATHLPGSGTAVRGCFMGIEKTAGGTSRTFNVDAFSFYVDNVSG